MTLATQVADALNQGADRFQAIEIGGVPTVVDVVEEQVITHAAKWGEEQVADVLAMLRAVPGYAKLFAWEGLR